MKRIPPVHVSTIQTQLANRELKYTHILGPSSINVSVVSGNTCTQAKWKEQNLSGTYNFVEVVNDRPVYKVKILFSLNRFYHRIIHFYFQRNEKTGCGKEVFIWYNSKEKRWHFSSGDWFRARNNAAWMRLKSEGKKLIIIELIS